jgi:hypothetical protein
MAEERSSSMHTPTFRIDCEASDWLDVSALNEREVEAPSHALITDRPYDSKGVRRGIPLDRHINSMGHRGIYSLHGVWSVRWLT